MSRTSQTGRTSRTSRTSQTSRTNQTSRASQTLWKSQAIQKSHTSRKAWKSSSLSSSGLKMSHIVEYNNSRIVMKKIAALYSQKLMSDVCLVVDGVEYPAHRLILCASSQVFQVMLMNPQWSESQESRVVLQESSVCAAVFKNFLRYFYTGFICINHVLVMPILSLADKYIVKDLVGVCLDYMIAHVAHAAVKGQLVSWLQYANDCGHKTVAQECKLFIKRNLDIVVKADDFENFEPETFIGLLQQSDLVVHDEMTLYQWAVKWLNGQHTRLKANGDHSPVDVEAHMQNLVKEVMSHIRFPMIPPRLLADLILSPLTTNEFFLKRMKIGMMYHKGQMAEACKVMQEEGGRFMFTPRLYTTSQWGTPLTLENFNMLPAYHSRTLVFSSHRSLADCNNNQSCEWIVDVYPKGVWFMKFYQIVWHGTVEVPERVLKTVRVSLTCNERPLNGEVRVRVAILLRGIVDTVEHIVMVAVRDHRFSSSDTVLNFDDLLPFKQLNPPPSVDGHSSENRFLVGNLRDCLKLHVVIVPLDQYCIS